MDSYQETELKLRLTDPRAYDRLVSDLTREGLFDAGPCKEADYDNIYYDTADHRLLSSGLALRLRNTGEGFIATVKDSGTVSGGLFVRGEWNKTLETGEISVECFSDLPVGPRLASAVGGAPIAPLIETSFHRLTMDLEFNGSQIELAADRGVITGSDGTDPLCEVELELKSGNAAALLHIGAALAGRYPLLVDKRSKFERGLKLSGFDTSEAEASSEPVIAGKTIRSVLSGRLIAMIGNALDMPARFLDRPDDPKSARRIMASLNRLRSLLSLAKPVLNRKLYAPLVKELKALADDFSDLCCLDGMYDVSAPDSPQRLQRQTERDRLLVAVADGPMTSVLLGAWESVLGDLWTQEAEADFSEFSGKCLNKHLKKAP